MIGDRYMLEANQIYLGNARDLLPQITPNSVACSVWSPPYHVGKTYEKDLSYDAWVSLLETVIALHYPILKPGGFWLSI
jgi:DNA modification methylase